MADQRALTGACACGWQFPVRWVRTARSEYHGTVERADVAVEYDCPRCGETYIVEWEAQARTVSN